MNERLTSIVCPNCGANSTNHKKCDFCGSILVQYADKNVKCLDEKFGKSVRFIPGLDSALEENFSLQGSCPEDSLIVTRIYPPKADRNNTKAINDTIKRNRDLLKLSSDSLWLITPPDKTALGTNYYEIISSRDSSYLASIGGNEVNDSGLCLRFPFANNNNSFIREYGICYDINNPKDRWVNTYMDSSYSELTPYKKVETVFRERIDYEGLFKAYRYNGGLFYLLDLGRDIDSAARIITYYVQLIEKAGVFKIPIDSRYYYQRNIMTFDVETLAINKNDIILDPNTGNIVKKDEVKPLIPEKKSFWEKLFG